MIDEMASGSWRRSLVGISMLTLASAACGVTDDVLLVPVPPEPSPTKGSSSGGSTGFTTTTFDSGRGSGGGGPRASTGGSQAGTQGTGSIPTTSGSTTPPDFDSGFPPMARQTAEGLRIVDLRFGPSPGDAAPYVPSNGAPDASDAGFVFGGGLCAPCSDSDQCATAGAYCVENTWTNERFCSRPCDGTSCPESFDCVALGGGASPQCVPSSRSCGPGLP